MLLNNFVYKLRLIKLCWMYLVLCVKDIEKMIVWYWDFIYFEVFVRNEDELGYGVWIGDFDGVDLFFLLVVL